MFFILYCMVVVSTFKNLTYGFKLTTGRFAPTFKLKETSILLSSKPDPTASTKMSKNKVKIEVAEVAYDVTRPSGFVLEGTLTHPKDAPANGPIIVFVHGTMSSKDHNFVPDLCKKMIQDYGIRSFRFNSRFDKSDAEPTHRYKFSGYEDDIDDLKSVINKLKSDGFTPFCLFGHSRGANDVLLYASKFSNSASNDESNSKKIINDSRESKIDTIENKIINDIELEINDNKNSLKIGMNNENIIKLPKNLQEIENEKEVELRQNQKNLISTTPRTITSLSSSSLLSDLNLNDNIEINANMRSSLDLNELFVSNMNNNEECNKILTQKQIDINMKKEIRNEIKIEGNKEVDSRVNYNLDSDKLMIVVAAPRYNMPKMLSTLFTLEQIAQLDTDGKFEWSSSEKGNLYVTQDDANVVLNEMKMSEVLSQIPDEVPVLLLHGTDDELISLDDAHSYKKSRDSIDLFVIDGARHAFRGKKQLKQFLSISSDWISMQYNKIF